MDRFGAVVAAKYLFIGFHTVTNHLGPATGTGRSERGYGAFKAVKSVRFTVHRYLKRVLIMRAAFFAFCHIASLPFRKRTANL
jgi:phosphate/sulfate permease